jgi:hypothetical protein
MDKGQWTNGDRLPQPGNRIRIKSWIDAQNRNSFHHSLRDQQTVEWVTVMKRQRCQHCCMLWLDSQDAKAIAEDAPLHEGRVWLIQGVFFQTDLDGNFQ